MLRALRSPHARRWMMQGFLCAILGGTLLLAAVVSNRVTRSEIRLERAAELGGFLMQRPAGWTERYTPDGVVFEESTPRGRPRRRLEVWTSFSPIFLSPLEFIARSDDRRLADTVALMAGADAASLRRATTPLQLAGWNGVLLRQSHLSDLLLAQADRKNIPLWRVNVAATLLPSGQVLLVRLEGESLEDAQAERTLRRLARTLRLPAQPYPAPVGDLTLEHGIELKAPPTLATFPAATVRDRDDLRISSLLIAQDSDPWLAVDIVPCITRPGEREDVLQSIMMLRDPQFRTRPLEWIDETTWACRRDDARYPAMVFRHDFGNGLALLAEFRWLAAGDPAREESRVRDAWTQIARTLSVTRATLMPQMIERGREVATHLPSDARSLLERAQPESQWQWYHETIARQSEFQTSFAQDELALSGEWEADRGPPLTAAGQERGAFWLRRDWNDYRLVISRRNGGGASQFSRTRRGRLRTTVLSHGGTVVDRVSDIDASFVPGPLFMLVLGRLPPEPIVLSSDWLINPTGGASAAPLTLLLTPVFDKAQTRPEAPARGHSWRVLISGRSFASHWQLDQDGAVHSVMFGGKVRLRRIRTEEGEGKVTERKQPDRGPSQDR